MSIHWNPQFLHAIALCQLALFHKTDNPPMWISTIMKPKVLIAIAKPMIASKHNSDDLPPNLSTQEVISNLWTKIDRIGEFFANHMHLIMGHYLVKLFFMILSKKMWLIGICHAFLHNFVDLYKRLIFMVII